MVFLGIDWGKILSVPFWLEVNPGELSEGFEKFFLIVLLVCVALYGASKLRQRQLLATRSFIKAKFMQKISTYFLTMAVCFTFIFFFRYEAIPVLGGRFWVFLWLVTGLVWAIFLIRYYVKELPRQLKEMEDKNRLRKYFVKK